MSAPHIGTLAAHFTKPMKTPFSVKSATRWRQGHLQLVDELQLYFHVPSKREPVIFAFLGV